MSFNDLSLELLRSVFSYCSSGQDQESIAQVCHRWADAVQTPALRFKRTCLIVSTICHQPRTLFIGERTLLNANRRHTGLNIEWSCSETDEDLEILEDLLDICEDQFTEVTRLYLLAPPSGMLSGLFKNRQLWLWNLVELDVELEPAAPDSEGTELCEVTFPYLRKLFWCEFKADGDPSKRCEIEDVESCHAFSFRVPELRELTVGMNFWLNRSNLESRQRDLDTCWLFLPTLELKYYENLETVTIEGIRHLDQRCVDNSESFLRNLRVLTFVQTDCGVIERICEKCSNLKQLIIKNVPTESGMFLQISPTLSPCLEHLIIVCVCNHKLQMFGDARFLKLQSIALRGVNLVERVTLDAPQLTQCDTLSIGHDKLTFAHVEPIRILNVMISKDTVGTVAPEPPNVEFICFQLNPRDKSYKYAPNYITHFPTVRHLTVLGTTRLGRAHTLELFFVERLQRLEYFCAHDVTLRMIDVKKLAGLKSLTLTNCILKVRWTDGEVSLAAVETVKIEHVAVDGPSSHDWFPIRLNERQPPVVFEKFSFRGLNVFKSINV